MVHIGSEVKVLRWLADKTANSKSSGCACDLDGAPRVGGSGGVGAVTWEGLLWDGQMLSQVRFTCCIFVL